jgi:hypothetical protein
MGFLRKKSDPISDRTHALNAEIAALQGEIKKLNAGLEQTKTQPRLRSTALPHSMAPSPPAAPAGHTEVFETVDHERITAPAENQSSPEHYNDLGLRKYDLVAVWRRFRNLFRRPPPSNPKLLNLLAAGNFQGLRPLRYEKRVARNRFIALVIFFVLLLYGIFTMFFRHR